MSKRKNIDLHDFVFDRYDIFGIELEDNKIHNIYADTYIDMDDIKHILKNKIKELGNKFMGKYGSKFLSSDITFDYALSGSNRYAKILHTYDELIESAKVSMIDEPHILGAFYGGWFKILHVPPEVENFKKPIYHHNIPEHIIMKKVINMEKGPFGK